SAAARHRDRQWCRCGRQRKRAASMTRRRRQDWANVVGVMGGLDRSIQRPAVAVDEVDGLGKNQWSDGAVKENAQGHCCCDRRFENGGRLKAMEASSPATEGMESSSLAAAGNDVLRPHWIWCPSMVGLLVTHELVASTVGAVEPSPSMVGSYRIRERSSMTSWSAVAKAAAFDEEGGAPHTVLHWCTAIDTHATSGGMGLFDSDFQEFKAFKHLIGLLFCLINWVG
ncbi:hypothetical protein ACLOJK_019154, partial [Asimina triloba]